MTILANFLAWNRQQLKLDSSCRQPLPSVESVLTAQASQGIGLKAGWVCREFSPAASRNGACLSNATLNSCKEVAVHFGLR